MTRSPLKYIVAYERHPIFTTIWVEVLECGHKQAVKTDIYGETNAVRRRCRKCRDLQLSEATETSSNQAARKEEPEHK